MLGAANLTAAGTATISPVLAPGTYSIVATYAGDADDGGSQSAPFALTVAQAQTATVLTAVPNPSSWLQSVTFTATVTGNGAIPTGMVQFFANGGLIGAGTLNLNGVATLTYSNLAIGTYAITATYEGDANDAGSTSLRGQPDGGQDSHHDRSGLFDDQRLQFAGRSGGDSRGERGSGADGNGHLL